MALEISKVELHVKENNKEHRTDDVTVKRLMVRRGQNFKITLKTNRQFQPDTDTLIFTAETGPKPSEEKGTRCVFGYPKLTGAKKAWTALVQESGRSSMTLAISSPADASVGSYNLYMREGSHTTPQSITNMVLLFNPWCTEDWVHLPEEAERQEYVMAEEGIIYRGSADRIGPLAWNFGQFEEDMVDICMKLLDMNPKCLRDPAEDFSARCNPIYVGRVVSAMINANGDRGILAGRWQTPYSGGVAPTKWSSSVDILRRWYKSYYSPVKYGQCWVFAGVMCTVLRCLGIPCRVVSNFQSAHDTDKSLTIDEYYTDQGVRPKESHDSVWNFHVWVEGWMKRPDLSGDSTYDGWQVLDPTPQEQSSGVFCCGPCPVKAVLEGHTDLKYDIPFVFAEVNADQVIWMLMRDGSKHRLHTDSSQIGQKISTKAVGAYRREDITASYKYPEGSKKERLVFEEAVRRGNERKPCPELPLNPPALKLEITDEKESITGQDLELSLLLHSDHLRELSVQINAQAMRYTGVPDSLVYREEKDVLLQPKQDLKISIRIPFSLYGTKMLDNSSLKVSALVHDKQHPGDGYLAVKNIIPQEPTITIQAPSTCEQFTEMTAEVIFENPISSTVKNGILTLTGSGLLSHTVVARVPVLKADQRVRLQIPFTPYRAGSRKLMADFDCDTFRNMKGSCNVEVKPNLVVCPPCTTFNGFISGA
ncbi:LOW QUALITY PROTEIN: protein-glutamine gamma-glutamyltransferase 2-like [Clupea harengus]|uniref:Protein-glutamine gamma-glutamyltransferase 2 n=1 Tax=Clupea harengus TaxID=7950 RepID=A0A8M1KII1_CLUHA|nr:LOW QUALITY PROTEIN: protein-glutamine gamma-glutamyltransferase 2-like [Clupea harengus]